MMWMDLSPPPPALTLRSAMRSCPPSRKRRVTRTPTSLTPAPTLPVGAGPSCSNARSCRRAALPPLWLPSPQNCNHHRPTCGGQGPRAPRAAQRASSPRARTPASPRAQLPLGGLSLTKNAVRRMTKRSTLQNSARRRLCGVLTIHISPRIGRRVDLRGARVAVVQPAERGLRDNLADVLHGARGPRIAIQRLMRPINRSTYGFCYGDHGADTNSSMPMVFSLRRNAQP